MVDDAAAPADVEVSTPGRPSRLVRLARKHCVELAFKRWQAAFATEHREELMRAVVHDLTTCVVCRSTHGSVVRIGQDPACKCRAHMACAAWLRSGEAVHTLRECPRCFPAEKKVDEERVDEERVDEERVDEEEKKRVEEEEKKRVEEEEEEAAPKKRRRMPVLCSTPIGWAYCCLPRGHLGHCSCDWVPGASSPPRLP